MSGPSVRSTIPNQDEILNVGDCLKEPSQPKLTCSELTVTGACECSNVVRNGLEGVIVAETTISTVGIPKIGLTYRGFPITQLIGGSTFEEVAYILIIGTAPYSNELRNFKSKIAQGRQLSLSMRKACEMFSADSHPMDVIRTMTSFYGAQLKDEDQSNLNRAGYLIGFMPSIVCYWYNFAMYGKRIDTVADSEMTVAEHFLTCLNGSSPSRLSIHSLDKTLIGYAEHDLNASTFSARVTTSTLADYYGAIVSAIGTLKGPLHGGANEAALDLLEKFDSPEEVPEVLSGMLSRKEKVMGFGHRVYKSGDPRHFIMKDLAKGLSECPDTVCRDEKLFNIGERLETEMISRKKIYPNLDFFAAVVYKQLGIPKSLFTALFAIGRTAGWTAHIDEQLKSNKLIRPNSCYVGNDMTEFCSKC